MRRYGSPVVEHIVDGVNHRYLPEGRGQFTHSGESRRAIGEQYPGTETAKLTAAGVPGIHFGDSVAIDGDTIVVTELLPPDRIKAICDRTANGGAEITKLVGTSAWYAPGASVVEMVEAYHRILPTLPRCRIITTKRAAVFMLRRRPLRSRKPRSDKGTKRGAKGGVA
mgnify:CR=1 FL=1